MSFDQSTQLTPYISSISAPYNNHKYAPNPPSIYASQTSTLPTHLTPSPLVPAQSTHYVHPKNSPPPPPPPPPHRPQLLHQPMPQHILPVRQPRWRRQRQLRAHRLLLRHRQGRPRLLVLAPRRELLQPPRRSRRQEFPAVLREPAEVYGQDVPAVV